METGAPPRMTCSLPPSPSLDELVGFKRKLVNLLLDCIQVRIWTNTFTHSRPDNGGRLHNNLLHIDIISPMGNKLLGFTKAKCFTFITSSSSSASPFCVHSHELSFRLNGVSTTTNERENGEWRTELESKRKGGKQFSWKPSFIIEDWIVFLLLSSIHPSTSMSFGIYFMYLLHTCSRIRHGNSSISHLTLWMSADNFGYIALATAAPNQWSVKNRFMCVSLMDVACKHRHHL